MTSQNAAHCRVKLQWLSRTPWGGGARATQCKSGALRLHTLALVDIGNGIALASTPPLPQPLLVESVVRAGGLIVDPGVSVAEADP